MALPRRPPSHPRQPRRRQQGCNNLPQCPAQPLSPFTLLLIAHLITMAPLELPGVLCAGREADKEYLSLLSA